MLRLETKLGTNYIRFCGCYWANNRRAEMKTTHLPLCSLVQTGALTRAAGQEDGAGLACQKKRIKEEYLTTTEVLADCRPHNNLKKKRYPVHLCDQKVLFARNTKAIR